MKKRLLLTAFVLSPLAVLAILMWLLARGLWEQATRPHFAPSRDGSSMGSPARGTE